ncbi:MAG: transporter substrate-binding domain-containing protein [Rhizobiaceae bacterium]|nr:transporter substrate-binding domain-containing protein [Rhizobiaceae bacterium]
MKSSILSLLLLFGLTVAPALAQSPNVPVFWDEKEQFTVPDLSTRERIRFLTTTDFAPFNFLDANGRLSGFHVDLARAICRELKISDRCQIQALPWSELDAALSDKQGEALLAGVAITAESREKYAFTRPYLRFPARFVATNASNFAEPLYQSLQSRRIGVVAASSHERMLKADFPKSVAIPYPDAKTMQDELAEGKLDAVFGDGMRLAIWLGTSQEAGCCRFVGGPYIAPEHLGQGLAIAVPKEDQELAQAFNYALHEIGVKGIFAELYLRYFPISFY